MIPRLLTNGRLLPDVSLELDEDAAHHAVRVLRLGPGDPLELFDGNGTAADAVLTGTRPATARVTGLHPIEPAPALRLTLAQCLSSADKMDWTIEKAVELGASAIIPLQAARSIVRLDTERAARRHLHWRRLIVAACGQCRRNHLPRLDPVAPLEGWLRTLPSPAPEELRLILAPGASLSLATRLGGRERPRDVTILCGPESGFGETEFELASERGWHPVGLGPRVLRTETAGLVALALLQGMLGDLR